MALSCMAVSVSAVILPGEYTIAAKDDISKEDYGNAGGDTVTLKAALTTGKTNVGTGWKWDWSTKKDEYAAVDGAKSDGNAYVAGYASNGPAIKIQGDSTCRNIYRALETPVSLENVNEVQVQFDVSDGTGTAANRGGANAEADVSGKIAAGYVWCDSTGNTAPTDTSSYTYTKPYIKIGESRTFSTQVISTEGKWNAAFVTYTLKLELDKKSGKTKATLTAASGTEQASVSVSDIELSGSIDYLGLFSQQTARMKNISIGTKTAIVPVAAAKDSFDDYAVSTAAPTASLGTGFLDGWNFADGAYVMNSTSWRRNYLRTAQCYDNPLKRSIQGEIDFSSEGEYFVKVTAANVATSENGKKAHNLQIKLGDKIAFGSKADSNGTSHNPTITVGNGEMTTQTQPLDLTKCYDYYLHIITSETEKDKIKFAVSECGIAPSTADYTIYEAALDGSAGSIEITNGQYATCGIVSVEVDMFNSELGNYAVLQSAKGAIDTADGYKKATDAMSEIADSCAKDYLKRLAAEKHGAVRIVDYTLDSGSAASRLNDIKDSAGAAVRCVYRYENTTDEAQTVKRVMALYVDGKLADCIYSPSSVTANSTSGLHYVGFYSATKLLPENLDMSRVQVKLYSFFGNGMTAYEDEVVLPNSAYSAQ